MGMSSPPFCFCSSARRLWLSIFIQRAGKPAAHCVCEGIETLCDCLAHRGGNVPPLLEGILSALHTSALGVSLPCNMWSWFIFYMAVVIVSHFGVEQHAARHLIANQLEQPSRPDSTDVCLPSLVKRTGSGLAG